MRATSGPNLAPWNSSTLINFLILLQQLSKLPYPRHTWSVAWHTPGVPSIGVGTE